MNIAQTHATYIPQHMKKQFIINFVLNALFTYLAIQSKTVVTVLGTGMLMDFMICNFFLISCVLFFTQWEIKKDMVKKELKPIKLDTNLPNSIKALISIEFIKYSFLYAGGYIAAAYFIFGDAGIPMWTFLAIKVFYACTLALVMARKGAIFAITTQ